MNEVDIAIVGAGLVGTPLAQVLSRQGWSVALLDAGVQRSSDTAADPAHARMNERCTAVSLGTQRWFADNELWSSIAPDACAIKQVHVSHKGYFGSTRLNANELAADAVGYVVSNAYLNQALVQNLETTDVNHLYDARVSAVNYVDDHVQIQHAQGTVIAKLLIAADGVSSLVRDCAGIDTRQVDYDQVALLGTVKLKQSHKHIAYERFTPSGPLALLPRPGPYMSFVDCIDPHEAQLIESLDDEQYRQRLQKRFGYRLGEFDAVGPRFSTPLIRIEACEQVAPRTVLLGNAMRLLHPVGGQGYNLALRDVAQLQRNLETVVGSDAGDTGLLTRFAEQRQADQNRVVRFSDYLARGFRGHSSLPAHVRALGLLSLDTVSPLRERFARQTMGLS